MCIIGPYTVTLSTFATLSVNSEKGLSRWAARCFAAQILRYAQDDRGTVTHTNTWINVFMCIIGPY